MQKDNLSRICNKQPIGAKNKMVRNGEPSAVILNNVSVLSSVLHNSQNIASTSTSDGSVEEEVWRIFHPGSVRDVV